MKHFWLTTITYRTSSAPYLAIKALKFPIGSKIALNDFYVGDNLQEAMNLSES